MAKIKSMVVGDISTNCYLIFSEDNTVAVVDPGDLGDKIAKYLQDNSITPKYILLTHGHHDHIGGIKPIVAQFPEVKVAIGKDDAIMLTDMSINYAKFRQRGLELFENIPCDIELNDGDTISFDGVEISVVSCPGHTRGGVCYICDGDMFTGDSLFAGDIGRTDLFGGDYQTLIDSVTKIMKIPGEYNVHPGHGPSSTMKHERKHNNYVRV